MAISSNDITALTESLNNMLCAIRGYQQLTVQLLNSDIEQANELLKERQRIIDDINLIESGVHDVLYRVSGAASDDNFGRALGKLKGASQTELNDVIALANQLAETFRDVAVIDAKLISNVERQREAMIEELKDITDRRRVAHTPYFDVKAQTLGSAYDKKK